MENNKLTAGQKRVRASFNPNQLPIVEMIKSQTATLMDTLDEYGKQAVANMANASSKDTEKGDFLREINTAKTEIQSASMWAVAAVTNDYPMEAMKGQVSDSMQPMRWINFNEWEAYQDWKAKQVNRIQTEV